MRYKLRAWHHRAPQIKTAEHRANKRKITTANNFWTALVRVIGRRKMEQIPSYTVNQKSK